MQILTPINRLTLVDIFQIVVQKGGNFGWEQQLQSYTVIIKLVKQIRLGYNKRCKNVKYDMHYYH